MTEFNKHGEHDNDMDYIVDLQAEINTLKAKAELFDDLIKFTRKAANSGLSELEFGSKIIRKVRSVLNKAKELTK